MLEVKIRQIGNSNGLILPKEALQSLHLEAGDPTILRQEPGGVLIMKKKSLRTLGKGQNSTEFEYTGSVGDGVFLLFKRSKPAKIDAALFEQAMRDHAGKTVVGGFDKKDIHPGGLGEWLYLASNRALTPQHASFMAAILCAEAGVKHHHEGNSVLLTFP